MNELALRPSLPDGLPYGLVSLWDMLRVDAEAFLGCLGSIRLIQQKIVEYISPKERAAYLDTLVLRYSDEETTKFSVWFEAEIIRFAELCAQLPAKHTADYATETAITANLLTANDALLRCDALLQSLQRDLRGVEFLTLDAHDRDFFKGPDENFIDLMEKHFDGASFNFIEAGKCIALERYTAAVLHVCRAIEPALMVVASRFDVDVKEGKSWGVALGEIRTAIGIRDEGKQAKWKSKDERKAVHSVAQHFWSLKTVLRDPATHKSSLKYVPQEAKDAYNDGMRFMSDVVKLLSQDAA